MNVSDIKKEGLLIIAEVDGVEYVAKSPISLTRMLCRMGMAHIQAAFVYTRIMGELQA
jgi:hypothetical protein